MERQKVRFLAQIVDRKNHSITLGYSIKNLDTGNAEIISISRLEELVRHYTLDNMLWHEDTKSVSLLCDKPQLSILEGEFTPYGLVAHLSGEIKETPVDISAIPSVARYALGSIIDFINNAPLGHVCAVYGLRRTGKTVLLMQAFRYCKEHSIPARMFTIPEDHGITIDDLCRKLDCLIEEGIKVALIDEITFIEDFQKRGSRLANEYASKRLAIIIAGTNSLGIYMAGKSTLLGRLCRVDTSYMPFREFKMLFPDKSLEEYMHTACAIGLDNPTYAETHNYIDDSIVTNILQSYEHAKNDLAYKDLQGIARSQDLGSLILRIIDGFSAKLLTSAMINTPFRSQILGRGVSLYKQHNQGVVDTGDKLIYDGNVIMNKLNTMDKFVHALSLKRKPVEAISDDVLSILYKYLECIGVLHFTEPRLSPEDDVVVCQQWWLVLQCAEYLISTITDEGLRNTINNDVHGRLLEQIVQRDTTFMRNISARKRTLAKYANTKGITRDSTAIEIDLVVANENLYYDLYEIKWSKERIAAQARHLLSQEVSDAFKIKSRNIIYNGETCVENYGGIEVNYINAEEYLLGLYND